ncbi:MAG TPA: hypothetical protein VGL94_17675 [Ktedonobacteraceae bacterium]|jgi:hypothetical protein
MITDDPQDMEQKLTQYVKDARQALETLEELSPSNTIPRRPVAPGSEEERYTQALNKLNTARTWLGIAAEQLHDRLNVYHERMLYAGNDEANKAHDEPFTCIIPKEYMQEFYDNSDEIAYIHDDEEEEEGFFYKRLSKEDGASEEISTQSS